MNTAESYQRPRHRPTERANQMSPEPAQPHAVAELVHRVSDALRSDLDEATFTALALDIFSLQLAALEPYRRLCAGRGITAETIGTWQQIPAVPVAAFKSLRLHIAPPREIFRSSGTTGGRRSVHFHPFPDLYRRVIDASFPDFCLPPDPPSAEATAPVAKPFLALVPPRHRVEDSSLGFMVDHVMRQHGGPDSHYAFGPAGVDIEAANAWCQRRHHDGRPGLVLATSLALAQWLEALRGANLHCALPPGSAIFDTGGFKGRRRSTTAEELRRRLQDHLAIPAQRVVREYGMTELTSQFYTRSLLGGDGETFVGPPWLRAHLLDPLTLQPLSEASRPGLLAILDLANIGSVVHVLTQDLAMHHDDGFRLLGRATGAELRGCSLAAEELEG